MAVGLKVKWPVIVVLCLGFGILGIKRYFAYRHEQGFNAIALSPQNERAELMADYYGRLTSGREIQSGMSKELVKKILGEPQNSNSKYVWVWIYDYDQYVKTHKDLRWQKMVEENDGFGVVFDSHKTTSTIFRLIVDHPSEVYAETRRIPWAEAKKELELLESK